MDEITREMIRHENELINQRLTWLGTFQGLLLAALAFAWDKKDVTEIVWVICILGAMVALSTSVSTIRANRAINDLRARWDKTKPRDYSGPDVEGVRSVSGFFWWLMHGYALPWLFFAAWGAITIIHFRHACAG